MLAIDAFVAVVICCVYVRVRVYVRELFQSLPSMPPTRVLSRLSRNSGQRRRWLMNQLLTCVMLIPVA
jgi:hypothetical protein